MKTATLPRNPERWNDPRPHVTAAVHAAMCEGTAGPALEIFMASFTYNEQMAMAHALAMTAVSTHLSEKGK